MAGKWQSSRFGDIDAGDIGKIRDVVETLFDDGDLNDDFVSYVDNEGSLAYEFVDNNGDLTSKYDEMKESFIDAQVDEFSEGDDVCMGGCDFEWIDEPTREIVLMVKMTITDMDVDVGNKVREFINGNFNPDEYSVEVIKDEKEQSE